MKKLLLLAFCFTGLTAAAQNFEPMSKAFSLGAEIAIPTHSSFNTGLGFSGKVDVPIAKSVAISITGGYTRLGYKSVFVGANKSIPTAGFIPIKAGVKVYSGGFYIEGEAGAVKETNYDKSTLFAFAIGPGFLIPLGQGNQAIDFGFRYERWNQRLTQTGVRIAYRIGW